MVGQIRRIDSGNGYRVARMLINGRRTNVKAAFVNYLRLQTIVFVSQGRRRADSSSSHTVERLAVRRRRRLLPRIRSRACACNQESDSD